MAARHVVEIVCAALDRRFVPVRAQTPLREPPTP